MTFDTATSPEIRDVVPPPELLAAEAERDLAAGRIDAVTAAGRVRDAALMVEGQDSRRCLALVDRAVALDPQDFWSRVMQARIAMDMADLVLAGDAVARLDGLAADGDERDRLIAGTTAGRLAMLQGRADEAVARFARSVGHARALIASQPKQPVYRHDLALALNDLAESLASMERTEEALAAASEAAEVCEGLVAAHPDDARWPGELARQVAGRGDVELRLGRIDAARASYRRSLGLVRRRAEEAPQDHGRRHALTACLERFGSALASAGVPAAAVEVYREGLAITEALVAADPANHSWASDRTLLRMKLGEQLGAAAGIGEALDHLDRAVVEARELADRHPDNAGLGMLVVHSLVLRGETLARDGGSDAFASFMKAGLALKSLQQRGLAPPDWKDRARWLMERMMSIAEPPKQRRGRA